MSSAPQRRTAFSRVVPLADEAMARARLSVVPRTRPRAHRVPFVTLVSVILLGGVIGLLLFNTSMQQAAITASRLEEQAQTLSARQQGLSMELDQMSSAQNLALKACGLGMVGASSAAFLDLDTGQVRGEPVAAVAGPCGVAAPAPQPPAPRVETIPPPSRSGGAASTGRDQGERLGDRGTDPRRNRSGAPSDGGGGGRR
ncbi:hypothetical protein [Nocardioides sp. R-C-SC26]|uniref:hypothetical protein n=1 Tax=Nocardioides sp. R-C-SC26 TaxID=2870414 RepID=UPI001E40B992|nr:hypothetical protein [Nocardioides sp. R-C-SC26]